MLHSMPGARVGVHRHRQGSLLFFLLQEPPSMLESGEESTPKGNRPVASTPVPGSPW